MRHYCSYFDHRYLPRGIVMMRSIRHFDPMARFYILALDDKCKKTLDALADPGITAIPLTELEAQDPALLAVKPTRSLIEYYFTCSPCFPRYILSRFGAAIDMITYIDADTLFTADPEIIYREIGDASIAITPHRFSPERKMLERFGIFNVGWISWRNDASGRQCLADYRTDCLNWCHDRLEETRFADQKYLDKWPSLYSGVKQLTHPGINAAAWNINSHHISDINGVLLLDDRRLVFWHYHGLKETEDGGWVHSLDEHTVSSHPFLLARIYQPYVNLLHTVDLELKSRFNLTRDIKQHIRYAAAPPAAAPSAPPPSAIPSTAPAPAAAVWRCLGSTWPEGIRSGREPNDTAWLATGLRQRERLAALADADLAGASTAERLETLFALHAVHLTVMRRKRPALTVLEWNGGVAQFYHRLRRLLPEVGLTCTVKEVTSLCRAGRQLEPEVRFVDTAAAAFERRYDLVVADAGGFGDEDWRTVFPGLVAATKSALLLNGLPVVRQASSHVIRKEVEGNIFTCRVFNERDLDELFRQAGVRVLRRLETDHRAIVAETTEQPVFRSCLLTPA